MAATTAAVIGGSLASSLIGGAMANDAANRGLDAAERAQQNAMNQYNNIKEPTFEDLRVFLENPELAGEYAPELEQALNLGTSSMENVQAPAELKAQQMEALKSLAEIGKGGLSEGDKAAYREMQRMSSQEAQAQQNAILSNMAQRGTLGGGAELAARLQGSQNAANALSKGSDSLTKEAQSRALQALTQSGSLAGQIRNQDVGEQENVARARDAIAQFNVQNQQSLGARNVGARNTAQQQNLQTRQSLENQRAENLNKERMNNANIRQQIYNNALGLAQARAGQFGQQANTAAQRGAGNARAIGTAFNGISGAIGSLPMQKQQGFSLDDLEQDDTMTNMANLANIKNRTS